MDFAQGMGLRGLADYEALAWAGLAGMAASYAVKYLVPMLANLCWQAALAPLAKACGAAPPSDPREFFHMPGPGQAWIVRWPTVRHWIHAPCAFATGAAMGWLAAFIPEGVEIGVLLVFFEALFNAARGARRCVESAEPSLRREAEGAFDLIVGAAQGLACLQAARWAIQAFAG